MAALEPADSVPSQAPDIQGQYGKASRRGIPQMRVWCGGAVARVPSDLNIAVES